MLDNIEIISSGLNNGHVTRIRHVMPSVAATTPYWPTHWGLVDGEQLTKPSRKADTYCGVWAVSLCISQV